LGVGKTHHMKETATQRNGAGLWIRVGESKAKAERQAALREALQGFRSCVDFPSSVYWEDLMEMNPDAKILLTVRDSPEAWWKSARETILLRWSGRRSFAEAWRVSGWLGVCTRLVTHYLFVPARMKLDARLREKTFYSVIGESEAEAKAKYLAWIEDVKRKVPANRLIVFNVKQGWEPLCAGLGLPVPNVPFPRGNDTEAFRSRMKSIMFSVIAKHVIGAAAVALVAFKLKSLAGR